MLLKSAQEIGGSPAKGGEFTSSPRSRQNTIEKEDEKKCGNERALKG